MERKQNSRLNAHLRAIRTAIVGLALGVVTAGLVVADEGMAFPLFIVTCLVVGYAFFPTLGG